MNTTPPPNSVDPPRSDSNLKIALVAAGSLVVIVAIVSLFVQLAHMRRDMIDTHDSVVAEVAGLRDAFSSSAALQAKQLELLEGQLRNARGQVKLRADQLKTEQAQTQQEIRGAKQASEEANANLTNKIGSVSADVGGVKSQLNATQAELQSTVSQLQTVQGELGVQSGRIATNANELAALKHLGERNYFEFSLGKASDWHRVADISLLLKKTDPKKNRYTLDVRADDKRTEKKDRNVNEPIQFYTTKAKQPYELVVNTVRKDFVDGYLATPKVLNAR
jgi:chromosome segregation ATPase